MIGDDYDAVIKWCGGADDNDDAADDAEVHVEDAATLLMLLIVLMIFRLLLSLISTRSRGTLPSRVSALSVGSGGIPASGWHAACPPRVGFSVTGCFHHQPGH